jgi:methyl-accepting chemotaxis protein
MAASAATELSTSIDEISRELEQTSELIGTVATEANATNSKIGSLARAAQRIGDVVNMIRDIADQTNLLALNATIEAARAPQERARGLERDRHVGEPELQCL